MVFRSSRERSERREFLKNITAELIEVLIHQIIYYKRIYPDRIFCKRRMFNLPVMMSKQPWVNDYINKGLGLLNHSLYKVVCYMEFFLH